MNNMDKMCPIHPSKILRKEFMAPLGLPANSLPVTLRVLAPRVNDSVRERGRVAPDTVLRRARYFGTTPQVWLNRQINYDLKITQRDSGTRIEQEVSPRAA